MTIPLRQDVTEATNIADEQLRQSLIRAELRLMSDEFNTLTKYRNWYEGDQTITFGTEKFQETFGDAFEGFRDNWCGVVVDAMLNKLELIGLNFSPSGEEEQVTDDEKQLARDLWTIFRANDIDELQAEAHEGVLVEGRGAVIVWPDEEIGARIDWNPAQLVRVRYSDDDYRRPVFAVKRWITPSGRIRVNIYTDDFLYKYWDTSTTSARDASSHGVQALVPDTSPGFGLQPREIEGEPWPLPNPLRQIPVVEFVNKRGSEIKNVIPQQDAINYLLMSAMGASEHGTIPQKVIFTGANSPEDGWDGGPGTVWKIPPIFDAEGRPIPQSIDQFRTGDIDQYRNLTDAFLMHVALTTSTPVRYFFESDRGGRGDAPSGESLLVTDQPLIDKIEDRQTKFGNAWYRVAQLVAKAAAVSPTATIPFGEVRWKDPRALYRSALLEEGLQMLQLGVPFKFIIRKLGFSPEEVDVLEQMKEEEEQQKMEMQRQQMEMQAEFQSQPDPGSNGSSPPSE